MTRRITWIAAALLVGACGKDQFVQPSFGSGCSKGTLALGDTVHGDLVTGACQIDYNVYSANTTFYDTYKVHFTAGQGYLIREQKEADSAGVNNVDALLQLWTTDANGTRLPLGLSDDEGSSSNSNRDSELWFVAPTTADYTLFAMQYGESDSGGYRLAMQPCSVAARLDTAGTYSGLGLTDSPPNACLRHNLAGNRPDSGGVVMAAVPLNAGDSVGITVISDGDFQPALEMGGPDYDVYADLYNTSIHQNVPTGGPDTASVTFTATVSGMYTVLIGHTIPGEYGPFKVVFAKAAHITTVAEPVPQLKVHPAGAKQPTP